MEVKPRRRKYWLTRLRAAGITYDAVAARAGRSYRMVQYHVDRKKHSPTIARVIAEMLAEAEAAKTEPKPDTEQAA